MKLNISMSMGSNEAAVAEIDLKDVAQWGERVAPVLQRLEQRVGDRSRRIMSANAQMRDLFKTDPKTYNLVHTLVMLCMGQIPEPVALGLTDFENSVPASMRLQEAA